MDDDIVLRDAVGMTGTRSGIGPAGVQEETPPL